jgi:hypothetical protein
MLRFWLDFPVIWMVSFLEYEWMVFFRYRLIFLVLCFPVYRGIFFSIARYLASKFGTYLRLSPYMSFLPMGR